MARNRGHQPRAPRPKKKPANRRKAARAKRTGAPPPGRRSKPRALDPSAAPDAEVRFVQPFQSTKPYLCPACLRDIPAGTGHVVAVPPDAPDLRRHWHRACWDDREALA